MESIFFKTYGFNQALGSSVKALDYTDYDYAEALDVFNTTLSRLKKYVENVASMDTTRFRSLETGYTFFDLSEAISTIQNIDLDMISSYITLNTVTKDKDALVAYYQYTLERLEREQIVFQELLATIEESIKSYEKNTVMVFGATGAEGVSVSAAEASAQYDSLFMQKIETQENFSQTVQQIALYNKRLERLNSSSKANTPAMKAKVEEDLAKLNTKVDRILEDVNSTISEYYETVVFSEAYNILVPANGSSSVVSVITRSISDSFKTIFIVDAILFIIYFGAAVILSCSEEYRKHYGTAVETGQTEASESYEEGRREVKEQKNKRARK